MKIYRGLKPSMLTLLSYAHKNDDDDDENETKTNGVEADKEEVNRLCQKRPNRKRVNKRKSTADHWSECERQREREKEWMVERVKRKLWQIFSGVHRDRIIKYNIFQFYVWEEAKRRRIGFSMTFRKEVKWEWKGWTTKYAAMEFNRMLVQSAVYIVCIYRWIYRNGYRRCDAVIRHGIFILWREKKKAMAVRELLAFVFCFQAHIYMHRAYTPNDSLWNSFLYLRCTYMYETSTVAMFHSLVVYISTKSTIGNGKWKVCCECCEVATTTTNQVGWVRGRRWWRRWGMRLCVCVVASRAKNNPMYYYTQI